MFKKKLKNSEWDKKIYIYLYKHYKIKIIDIISILQKNSGWNVNWKYNVNTEEYTHFYFYCKITKSINKSLN